MKQSKYKPISHFQPGFIATTQEGNLSTCRFGGAGWSATGPRPDLGNLALLVTLDFGNPVLGQAVKGECNGEIPLFSLINLDGIVPLQEYKLDHGTKHVMFKPFDANLTLLPMQHRLPIPLPESALRLREMQASELFVDEASYWVAMDSFLGGQGVIRLFGPPLYIDDIAPDKDGFTHLAGIGYESPGRPDGLLGSQPFFPGEVAQYFFISRDWKTVRVITQAT